jgi:hypothetical protein
LKWKADDMLRHSLPSSCARVLSFIFCDTLCGSGLLLALAVPASAVLGAVLPALTESEHEGAAYEVV